VFCKSCRWSADIDFQKLINDRRGDVPMVPFALVLWTVWFTDYGRDLTGGQLRTREEPAL
jgi:hypothetical protein